ncbi:MAG: transposase [Verrucomicrobiaceae bacterium]|nr:transposase [Verrucomicrobiaceae bacterium]
MKKSRHSEEKIVSILREAQGGMKVRDVCARHNISEQTYYGGSASMAGCRSMSCVRRGRWRKKTGGSNASWRT